MGPGFSLGRNYGVPVVACKSVEKNMAQLKRTNNEKIIISCKDQHFFKLRFIAHC
jgi:allantoicase